MSSKVIAFTNSLINSRLGSLQSNPSKEVLREMFALLEEYAPTWYPEELHDRAVAVLRGARATGSASAPLF
jgi:hypothetical protein